MLFNRKVSLVVGESGGKGLELEGLRINFSIQKGATRNPNKCTVRIYNLSKESRAIVEVIGNVVILKAGYIDDSGASTIFTGNVIRYITTRENADFITELELKDGLLEFRDTKVSVSYSQGATGLQVIQDLAKRFNLPVRKLPDDVKNKQYSDGFAFVGRLRDAMDKSCDYLDLEWSIQNRQVQIIKKGGIYKQQALLLSPDTGLIGSPEQEAKTMTEKAAAKEGVTLNQTGVRASFKKNKEGDIQEVLQVLGYKVISLLQPSLEPGGYVQLKTISINGEFFRIEELTHNGDTHGNEFYTEMILRYPK